jgi:UDP-3-O-[3-hydroxymyristoyl] glucosamine N-acyltransferase
LENNLNRKNMSLFPLDPKKLALLLEGDLEGKTLNPLLSIGRIEDANEGDITFISDDKFNQYLSTTKASCIIIRKETELSLPEGKCYIRVNNPYISFVKLLKLIDSKKPVKRGFIHPTAIIETDAHVSEDAYIGPNCIIGRRCNIGDRTIITAGVILYENVLIGSDCLIHGNVTCYQDTIIGNRCIIHAGAVLGSDGFSFIENNDGTYDKIPQLGNVLVGDDVEIGANTTIDRSIAGSTIIGNGVKLDNLIHIGHNCIIGENTAMAAQVGISGSTKVGKRNRLAGQVGLAGHMETTDDVIILAQSGVAFSVKKSGVYIGSPIHERNQGFRIYATLNKLPEMYLELGKLNSRIEKLENPEKAKK